MNAPAKLHRPRAATSAAFVLTVGVAVVPLFLAGNPSVGSARGLALLACALAYTLLAAFDEEIVGDCAVAGTRRVVYFSVQVLLVAGLCVAARLQGMSALALLPLVSHVVMSFRGWPAVVWVGVIYSVFVATLVWVAAGREILTDALSIFAAFAFVIVFTQIAVREKEARANAERLSGELADANEQLRAYATRVEELAMTRERNRVAREIHDGLGHLLTTVAVQLEAALALQARDPARATEAVAKAQGLAQEALVEVRRSVGTLRAEGTGQPLPERLRELVSMDAGAPVTLEILGEVRAIGPEVAHGLFRAVQEGLTNVRRHAAAQRVAVTLDFRAAGRVRVAVLDDGRGAAAAPAGGVGSEGGGYGLRGLRERVELLGGWCEAGPRAEGGFALRVEVPA